MQDQRIVVENVEDLGAALRAARKEQGLTQQDFADISMVGVRFLSEVERGKETAEVGLVLKVLKLAGYDIVLERRTVGGPVQDRGRS